MNVIDTGSIATHLARLEAENHRLQRQVDARDDVIRDLVRTIAALESRPPVASTDESTP